MNLTHAPSNGPVPVTPERVREELAGAPERGEIVAHYQPQVDLRTGAFVGVESLARWTHPELGGIAPIDFIPVAEQSGLIHALGRFMIEDALRTITDWHSHGMPLDVSVNVSATQLSDPAFFDLLDSDLAALGLPAGALTIEITESQPIIETPWIARRLEHLREGGLGIAIDDYGTGHSSLDQLDRLPASELKIDHTLVQDESAAAHALMAAVTDLAHWRGMRVVAEGVETPEQLERMRQLGCERAQGYLLGRPLPKRELEEFISR